MELLEGIMTRRSYRAFLETPLSEETLARIISAAGRSPSYSNTQPWEVCVVRGRKRDELSRVLCEAAESDAPVHSDLPAPEQWPAELDARAKEHGARRFQALGIERGDQQRRNEMRLRNYQFYGAPCVIFLFMDGTLTQWSLFDMGLFAQTLILAAHSLGVGSCLQAALTWYPEQVRRCLGVPGTKRLVLGISLGYPDTGAPLNAYESSRVSAQDFIKWFD